MRKLSNGVDRAWHCGSSGSHSHRLIPRSFKVHFGLEIRVSSVWRKLLHWSVVSDIVNCDWVLFSSVGKYFLVGHFEARRVIPLSSDDMSASSPRFVVADIIEVLMYELSGTQALSKYVGVFTM
jgi:hypothetical protein